MVLPKEIASFISGAWLLLNNTPTDLNGTPLTGPANLPVGLHPVGMLTYHPTGYMSANIASTDADHRPLSVSYPFKANDSDADWAQVGKHTLAYAGQVSASEDSTTSSGTLTHGPLVVASIPSWVGTKQERNYTVYPKGVKGNENDVLHVWIRSEASGQVGNLFWERMP
ncbi:Lipocalin-like domain-containing protein [Massariosphaeria phaeospora]|uniref:Lipocalin-like domain-containing protein n=1 Tax=Massariosphaeria phaeospora TaxID=100035 RepID=A0A7C8MDI2_9PLEO|nr:Lipocalin-like domain-containing protein [Massariosphaeria phaeospora]